MHATALPLALMLARAATAVAAPAPAPAREKQLAITPGAGHVDRSDRTAPIPFDTPTASFSGNLSGGRRRGRPGPGAALPHGQEGSPR